MLDGAVWAVVRALGHKGYDVVVEGGNLDVIPAETAATGMEPLRAAITARVLGDATALMPASIGTTGAWQSALAWMTRDQECRFGHHLDWRDPESDSNSPIRGRSKDDRLAVVRALLGALSPQEISSRDQERSQEDALRELRNRVAHLDWQLARTREELGRALGGTHGTDSPIDVVGFKRLAEERRAKAHGLPATSVEDYRTTQARRDDARKALHKSELEAGTLLGRLNGNEALLQRLKAELPEASARLNREATPVCPICAVPIDKALAEGCGISVAPCDLNELRAGVDKLRADVKTEETAIKAGRVELQRLTTQAQQEKQRLKAFEDAVRKLEGALFARSAAVRTAERLVDDANRYELLLAERDKTAASVEAAERTLEQTRGAVAEYRDTAAETVRRLSDRFDAVLRELVPGDIEGSAKLDGNGLTLRVKMGGDRSTAAIDSLKVIAFDLAALTLSLEGMTRLPGFLLHDSPREADLGISIYSRLFGLAHEMERCSAHPLFQYVLTTTTAPPEEFRVEPWLRLTLHGTPAGERLLKVDL